MLTISQTEENPVAANVFETESHSSSEPANQIEQEEETQQFEQFNEDQEAQDLEQDEQPGLNPENTELEPQGLELDAGQDVQMSDKD